MIIDPTGGHLDEARLEAIGALTKQLLDVLDGAKASQRDGVQACLTVMVYAAQLALNDSGDGTLTPDVLHTCARALTTFAEGIAARHRVITFN